MSRRDYLPERDAAFALWCDAFVGNVSLDPARYGLDAPAAADVAAAYADFAAARQLATSPESRTRVMVLRKNETRRTLERLVRAAVHRIQSFPGTSSVDRITLGINPRAPRVRRIGPPTTRPELIPYLSARDARTILRLRDASPHQGSALPPGIASAVVFTVALSPGQPIPTDLADWRFECIATRALVPLPPRPADTGKRVYACAAWTSPRGELGPPSTPLLIAGHLALAA